MPPSFERPRPKVAQENIPKLEMAHDAAPSGEKLTGADYREAFAEHRQAFERFGGKHIPDIRFARDDEAVSTARFTHDRGDGEPEIVVGSKFFEEKQLSKKQAAWVVMHELGHFRDFAAAPTAFKRVTESFAPSAVQSAKNILEKIQPAVTAPADAAVNDSTKKVAALSQKIQSLLHRVYRNSLDDVWVNHTVSTDPDFRVGTEGGKARTAMYDSDTLFPSDISQNLLSRQFMSKLLLDENTTHARVFSAETEAALARTYKVRGETVTAKDIVGIYFSPHTANKNATSIVERHFAARHSIMPTYLELLEKDLIAELEKKQKERKEKGDTEGEGGKGEKSDDVGEGGDTGEKSGTGSRTPSEKGQPGVGDPIQDILDAIDTIIEAHEENSPDFIPDDVMEQFEKFTESKDAEQNKKISPHQKQDFRKNAEGKVLAAKNKWLTENSIDSSTAVTYDQILSRISPHLAKLSSLWKRLCGGAAYEHTSGLGDLYHTGTQVNITALVRQFHHIANRAPDKLRIMERGATVEKSVNKPERIEVSLVLDRSGSMFDNGAKMQAIEDTTMLIMKSLEQFNQYIDSTREETKTKLFVDTEVLCFGDDAQVVKPFRGKATAISHDRIAQYHTVAEMKKDYGGTNELPALDIIHADVEKKKELVTDGKLLKIVFFITDGGSDPTNDKKELVSAVTEAGVITLAIQVGKVSLHEKAAFTQLWNTGRQIPLGAPLPDVAALPDTIAAILYDKLTDVEI